MKNYYQILDLPTSATPEQIKKQYRRLLLETHPDKSKSNSTHRSTDIALLKEAYETLSDPALKLDFDQELTQHLKNIGISEDGLDEVDLDDFEYQESGAVFTRDCPRCTLENGFKIEELDLEANGTVNGAGEVVVQCAHCSLWLKVAYYDEGES